jgi:hypothetical protein
MPEREHEAGHDQEEQRRAQHERELLRTTSAQLGRVTRILRFADLMALLMVAATAFAGYAAWRTAQVTALFFAVSERPFLGVEDISFDARKPDQPQIVVQFRNFGHIPADEAIIGVHALLDGKLIHPPNGAMTVLDAGIVSPTVPHYFYAPIPAYAYRKTIDGSARLMVHVKMEYKGPEHGVDYCYFEKVVYYHDTASFRLSGGTLQCGGTDVY